MDPGDGDGERKPSRPLTVPLAFTQLISLLAGHFLPSFLFPIDPGPYLPVYSPPGVIALALYQHRFAGDTFPTAFFPRNEVAPKPRIFDETKNALHRPLSKLEQFTYMQFE